MNRRKDYPYRIALEDLRKFFLRVVKDESVKQELFKILNDAENRKTVPIRGLHEKLMHYRKEYNSYIPFTDEEREMLDDLMHFWG